MPVQVPTKTPLPLFSARFLAQIGVLMFLPFLQHNWVDICTRERLRGRTVDWGMGFPPMDATFFWFTLSYSAIISVSVSWLIMFCLKFCCYVEAPSIFLKSTSKKFQNTIEACSVGNKVKASFLGFSLWIILLSMLFSRHQIAHLAFACRYEVSIFLFTWRSHKRVLPCG
jgi:hypothetical protein